jgi:mannose-6-phosphate isomerase-like protein (cupin superfamily)
MNSTPTTLKKLSDAILEKHKNILVSEINDSCLRLAVNEGTYDWHHHPNSDELFMVLEGYLEIQFKTQDPVELRPGDIFTVPAKMVHRTIAQSRTVNLCFEFTKAETVFIKTEGSV